MFVVMLERLARNLWIVYTTAVVDYITTEVVEYAEIFHPNGERIMHKLYSSGSSWEATIGYSRAVQAGNTLYISATASSGPDGSIVGDDLYTQTKNILQKLGTVLADAGFSFQDVVQSRLYVTDITNWKEAGRAHGEVYGDIRPALTLLHVAPFVDPKILIEIELTAVKRDAGA